MRTKLLFILVFFSIISVPAISQENYKVLIETNYGNMVAILYNETPKHRDNFVKLVKEGYYDGQLFHRVIKDFMIQTGDPNSKDADKGELLGLGGPGYSIDPEFNKHLFHKKGALAAARKGDHVNPEKKSSGSQFYIIQGTKFSESQLSSFRKPFSSKQIDTYTTTGGSPHLDGDYTVFGELISGFEILDDIAYSPVDSYNRPVNDIMIKISIIQ